MDTVFKTKIDLSKITGPYPLLGTFLLVVEGLLGFWFFRAESAIERVVAGSLMTLLLGGFLLVVMRVVMRPKGEEVSGPIVPQGLGGKVTPAVEEATEEEIGSPQPQTIGAPDGSYIINKPPEDWIVRELTWADWISEGLRITDPSIKEKLREISPQVREILTFQPSGEMSVIPIPGKTTIDGRKFPTALEVLIPSRLAILPMDRAQPPLFVERSLTHNFLTVVGELLRIGVWTIHNRVSSGTIPNSQRPYLVAELRQEIEDAIVNGKEGKSVNSNTTVIGIEGELRDYLLIMNYPSLPAVDDPKLERNLQTIRSLVSSFRPLKIISPDEKRMEIKHMADQKFDEHMMKNGEEIFGTEFNLLLLRLRGWDMNDPEKRLRVMKLLKPFEIFAKEINLQDEKIDALWNSLRRAEEGDASGFKAQISQMISATSNEPESGQKDLRSLTSGNDEGKKNLNETEDKK